ncbi:MAG: HD domain-containing protein [Desulfovibrionales bacterium]
MNDFLHQLKREAKILASKHVPSFYDACREEVRFANELFFDHPLIFRCREDVLPFLNDSFGHGTEHAKKVAIEACAIVLVEFRTVKPGEARHLGILAQVCGLLHDICRLEGNHALKGSELSRTILQDYPFSDTEMDMICHAIRNHEAFQLPETTLHTETQLLTGALYDADKFRWGPDNFTTTLWEICDYQEWPVQEIVKRFPEGLQKMHDILPSFRTGTGQAFGPEFIQIGLKLGKTLYARLQEMEGRRGS